MLSEREVHPDVRALLMANEPLQYAHLIKFERPSRPDANGLVSTSAHKYTYLTDASRDVGYDDGSTDHFGIANGSQTYIANKVLNVTGVQENTEAKANNFSITLDGNGLGAVFSETATVTVVDSNHFDVSFNNLIEDLSLFGFREGDKVILSGGRTGTFNIHSFRENKTLRLKKLEDTLTAMPTAATITVSLASEEIRSILLDKRAADYASFINREVFIYRAYFKDGVMVGETPVNGVRGPILLFKGIISGVNFEDDEQGIKVQWSMTSHWGDFAQVKGRVTSDDFHRALDANGVPQPYSAVKPIYAYDKGFMHAETSVNILGTYVVQVEKQNIKTKKGFLGIGSKVKVKKYYVPENRYSPLDFQLQAKSIPLIYGVRNTTGIPVFADTLINDASTVYVIYALSEGEIGGIYDIYVDGKSLICNNQADAEVRSVQNSENTIDVVCRGRADRGDVLSGTGSVNNTANEYYDNTALRESYSSEMFGNILSRYRTYVPPTDATIGNVGQRGVIHGESITMTSPIDMTLDFFSGTEGQEAATQFVSLSKANSFKLQNDYWKGTDTSEYWGPNHRLLDTAYIAAKYKISEGESTIPEIEYIIRGKSIDCYNYDYSYAHDEKMGAENAANFTLGMAVTIHNAATNAQVSSLEIIDKWTFVRADGATETRFRFNAQPNLGYVNDVPSLTRFYMQNGANRWTMTTFNYVIDAGTIGADLTIPTTTVVSGPAGTAVINTTVTPPPSTGGTLTEPVYNFQGYSDIITARFNSGNSIDTYYRYGARTVLQ